MFKSATAAVCAAALMSVAPALAQPAKPKNSVTYDVTVTADGSAYTGTMDLAVASGKVTGDMNITAPTQITGKAAGTVKRGEFALDFPYRMVERACEGRIAMSFKLPSKPGPTPASGNVDITSCEGRKIPGTIEVKAKTAPKKQ